MIKNYLNDEDIDLCIISETWLKDDYQAWIDTNELNKDGYNMKTSHRQGRTGGGLACVYKQRYKVKKKTSGEKRSFQYAVFHVQLNDADFINAVGIYHPPPSKKNPPNSVFIDEFSKFLCDEIMQLGNFVLIGDFNIRINDQEDNDVIAFCDTLYALGLDQHVTFPTNMQGNTVDLVFTEHLSKINILQCIQGPFFSDHCAVSCVTSITRRDIKQEKISYRKLKGINTPELLKDIDLDKIVKGDN